MITNPQEMRALTSDLSVSTWTLAAIGAIFESGLARQLREPRGLEDLAKGCRSLSVGQIERCLSVASAVGVVIVDGSRYRLADGAMPFAEPPMSISLLGDIRSSLMQPVAFLDATRAAAPRAGWDHTDKLLLQAQGDASAGLAPMLKMNVIPSMGDLARRLEGSDARFLDVGIGVGSLAIAMCRAFPQLRVVGVDSYDLPLSMARENVARAGLEGRIDLVQSTIESLTDEQMFDLAWLPTFFIADALLPAATARVLAALRPGGWIIYPAGSNPNARPQQNAVFGLVNHLWGGPALSVERAETLLKEAGFKSVRTLPGPVWAPAILIGQRADS
jgi:predicted O-methyltransferase YrrM